MEMVGELSFEVVETKEGLLLRVRVVGSSRGCGFDTVAKAEELRRLARYLESAQVARIIDTIQGKGFPNLKRT